MIFIETSIFTEDVKTLLNDEEYHRLQLHLASYPEDGDLLQGTGGLRKIRWATAGKGKSGGVRVIYYHVVAGSQVRLLLIYRKDVQDTLTKRQAAALRKLNERWK